jgi:hypothetical protein
MNKYISRYVQGLKIPLSNNVLLQRPRQQVFRTGGFNHPRESLNPSLHTGGPRRMRSWIMEHGDDVVRLRRRL